MTDITDVLAKWMFEQEWGGAWEDCHESAKPGWIRSAQATIDFLSAAGFGPVQEAREAAWDEGYRLGQLVEPAQNPYRRGL